jgi:hypothetical protein
MTEALRDDPATRMANENPSATSYRLSRAA